MPESEIARALAFFQTTDDVALLRQALRSVTPIAARQVAAFDRQRREVPQPASIVPAETPGGAEQALRVLRNTRDFAELQALARAIGRRVEVLQGDGAL